MSVYNIANVNVVGVSACVPKEKFNIDDYEHFTREDASDFKKRVGINSKRCSHGKTTAADLCFHAAEKLIDDLGWERNSIGILVLVTQTPDYTVPASAIILQNRLNLSTSTIAFDINLGCSGWVYGLSVVSSLMNTMKIDRALLLAGETSIIAEYTDKKTFPLMGDAGTATALENVANANMVFDLNSDGRGYDAIIAPNSGARFISDTNAKERLNFKVSLDSQKILAFCLQHVLPSVARVIEKAATTALDIDYFVLHQANKIINESLRKKLNIPEEKLPYSLAEFGNTSSASIPLTIATQLATPLKSNTLSILCSGFGVGLSWGSVLLKTNNLVCSELIEV